MGYTMGCIFKKQWDILGKTIGYFLDIIENIFK